MSLLDGKSVLVTGGTGSFGRQFIAHALSEHKPKRLIVFSRDELKQQDMSQELPASADSRMRYFIGDVRDKERLHRAFQDVDIVVHAAALKQVPACEYNPFEAIQTNVMGAKNVIDAAIDAGVQRVIALSTDKAVNPVNLYGATKLCAEKIFIQANAYSGSGATRFSVTRYGNVVGSRGSVVPVFLEQRKSGRVTVTDPRMTRFWITLRQGVSFVIKCLEAMHGGEIFIPKIPSMRIEDLAGAIAPGSDVDHVGIRPGEKLHEVLISEDEARNTVELDDMFVVQPTHPWWDTGHWAKHPGVADGFRYASDTNNGWLHSSDIVAMMEQLGLTEEDTIPQAAERAAD